MKTRYILAGVSAFAISVTVALADQPDPATHIRETLGAKTSETATTDLMDKEKVYAFAALVKTTRTAASAFAKDHENRYPSKMDDEFKSYFPGGSRGVLPLVLGEAPLNPVTGKSTWPFVFATNLDARTKKSHYRETTKALGYKSYTLDVVPEQTKQAPGSLELWSLHTGRGLETRLYGTDGCELDLASLAKRLSVYKFAEGTSDSLAGADFLPGK